ncbi:MAG: glycosyltransferase family 2 protein [Nitrospinota bacterium]|nr:glycosyltransferase family 2 protein [Nitrospinota bacterium]
MDKGNAGKPSVSAVILTWNRREDLAQTLDILSTDPYENLEIIVIDNNSTDDTDKMVTGRFPAVSYLKLEDNVGIAGYNIGFKKAAGEYIVAFDSDSYPHRDAIGKMVKLFDENRDAGVVAFDVHSPTQTALNADIKDNSVNEIVGYHGAGVGFRREVFRDAGYWFEPFFLYFNEMDHAMRVSRAGYKIIRTPSIRAFHKSSISSRPSANGPYYYVRNALWLAWRNYPLFPMFWTTLHIIYMAVSEAFNQHTFIYIKALYDAFVRIDEIIASRDPLKTELFRKTRVPLSLAFSRWG